ncbi:uncharacterized protein LOC122718329 [Apis laboriosa]|uniref:Uncharacterized protein LOC408322 n=1 Tax=Apis mellifera TaxID=7460 RepID=A0A7M7GZP7_APIME|nr:uncharacterized protein LOC100871852 [Apis florea]XP_006570480.1 uncharacterized protein LOC408322 [Apis mellifera]XP_006570481.1 uncharacterized protein LOC408322 [Apis mellifera]XP_006621453.1 uncharacterized protein LOC102672770 [Apis dorsata]XP_031369121.1 uncharacterized protein LOC102672770 [Apis dorsata]XP_031369122.1 uncharacterized protein LOC102672770 [Apis dorsata]XP_031369123.1 uncharacterized protein LOC102672770 [Apis dorsata]XP_031772081.1 uncharacterized protein LOC1008718|eukprot:XP_006570480.1 uncharacterized protein LOC408322 [Apis mellifera]
MTSTVLVKLPTVPFPQGKKSPSDIITLTERNEGLNQSIRHQTINIDRIAQLEQNMKFLQEQHQATLVALHQEVESLRQKNRDLQFQLVFSKGSYLPSSPSSPEDNGTGFMKPKGSPVCVNITPLQVELLEKDLQDTKVSLQEARIQNQYLSEIIEQQKKKLNSLEEQKINKESMTDVGIQVGDTFDSTRAHLVACLESTEAVIKRLRKQNEEQREEIATLKATSTNTNGNKGARSRDSNNSHHSRGSPTSTLQEQSPHIFPPLQSYWHHKTIRNGRNRHNKLDHQTEMDATMLPQLQNSNIKLKNFNSMMFESLCYRSRGHRNYYRDESNRKYRGNISQKDRRDSDHNHHHNRRDYKDRSSKNQQKELADSAEGSSEADNSASGKS